MPTPHDTSGWKLVSAVEELTRQLQRNLEFYQDQDTKAKTTPVLREQQDEQMSLLSGPPQKRKDKRRQKAGQSQLFGTADYYREPADPYPPDSIERTQPDVQEERQAKSLGATLRSLQGARKDKGGSWRRALGSFAPGKPNDPFASDTASTPPDSTGSTSGRSSPTMGVLGSTMGPGGPAGSMKPEDALTWAVLGEHGGPAFIRNLALESYGLQRSIGWAQNTAGKLSDSMAGNNWLSNLPGMSSAMSEDNINAVQGALNVAQNHPLATYAAYKVGSAAVGGIQRLSTNVQNWENIGAQLGAPVSTQRYLFGMHNPLSPFLSASSSIGMGAEINKQQLEGRLPGGMGMGSGLSGQQATDIISQIVGQGYGANENKWGGGDIGAISNQFMGPLMKQMPGLSAADLGQFLPALRYSGTSLDQLTSSLSDLGTAAGAAHETVGEMASSMNQYAQSTGGMGSYQGALNAAQAFHNITGMDPQILGEMAHNSLTRAMAVTKFGILPSAFNDLSQGAQTAASMSAIQLYQKAFAGLNHPYYATINGKRREVLTGQQAVNDQVAQMMFPGDPYGVTKLNQLMRNQKGEAVRTNITTALGGPGGFENMASAHGGKLSNQERTVAQQYWMQNIAPNWRHSGISQKEMHRLNNLGFDKRIKRLKDDMNTGAAANTSGQVQQHRNSQTVYVKFTGAAAKLFQQAGPTTAKQASNAGGVHISGIVNSVLGVARIGGDVASMGESILSGNPEGLISAGGNLISDIF